MRPVIIIMVKAPRAGLVKTRLAASLGAEATAGLAACFAQDALSTARRATPHVIIAYAPSDGRALLEQTLGDEGLDWFEQTGRDLGERLERAALHAFREGYGPVILLGADSPTLPHSFLTEAVAALASGEAEVALGPTTDGGYYLIGLARPARGLFEQIAWSTPQAYAETARNARRLGLGLHELPRWYDVDTDADLARLRAELDADEAARLRAMATHRWVEGMRDEG